MQIVNSLHSGRSGNVLGAFREQRPRTSHFRAALRKPPYGGLLKKSNVDIVIRKFTPFWQKL